MPAIAAALRDDLIVLSRAINADPELAYEERRAADRIVALLAKHGHEAERGTGGLATAFRARIGPPGPAVALLAEYDALPDVGHGCGHNLIAMTNVGAFLAAAERAGKLEVGIELIGTPAEEHGGGKIDLVDAGAFADIVAVLSSHPGRNTWRVGATSLGIVSKRVGYHGLAAHAAVSPEQGRNALNAVIRLFIGVDGWRQHLPADARVHGIITNGGAAQNIVPSYAEAVFGLRARELSDLQAMIETFGQIAQGAALQTGTTVEITDEMRLYEPMRPNPAMTELVVGALVATGVAVERGGVISASTDLGNVSQRIPTEYIGFPVSKEDVPGHSHAMREASVSDLAHRNALITIEALAECALRLATDASLRKAL